MKTLQELYDEVIADPKLRKPFATAVKSGKIVEFAKEHGCDASDDELAVFAASFEPGVGKDLTLEELERVAGGKCDDYSNCNHKGKGGSYGDIKKDYRRKFWYQRNTCGYCKKTYYTRAPLIDDVRKGEPEVEVSKEEYDSVHSFF